jgi:hypothetical protein
MKTPGPPEPSEVEQLRLESRRLRFLLRFIEVAHGVKMTEMIHFIDFCLDRDQSPEEAAAIAHLGKLLSDDAVAKKGSNGGAKGRPAVG